MEQSKINRINELAKKSSEEGLSDAEKAEQQVLRREYVEAFKKSLNEQLENTVLIDEAGNRRPLIPKKE